MLASGVEYTKSMQMTFDIHPQIEVGTISGTLRAFGEDLVCLVGDRFLRAHLEGERFVFSGGLHGEHTLDARASITSAARLVAHWRGYVENNRRSDLRAGGAL